MHFTLEWSLESRFTPAIPEALLNPTPQRAALIHQSLGFRV